MTKGKHMKVIRGEEKVNWKSKGVGGEINLCVPYDFICIVFGMYRNVYEF